LTTYASKGSNQIRSKCRDYGDISARNTTRAPKSMQLEIKAEKSKSGLHLNKDRIQPIVPGWPAQNNSQRP